MCSSPPCFWRRNGWTPRRFRKEAVHALLVSGPLVTSFKYTLPSVLKPALPHKIVPLFVESHVVHGIYVTSMHCYVACEAWHHIRLLLLLLLLNWASHLNGIMGTIARVKILRAAHPVLPFFQTFFKPVVRDTIQWPVRAGFKAECILRLWIITGRSCAVCVMLFGKTLNKWPSWLP